MSCPDWSALAAAREADPLADPAGLAAARRHLADCRDCRKAAARVDPLLLFSALGAVSDVAAAPHRSDVDVEMQNAVLALVRASRVATPAGKSRRWDGARAGRVAAALLVASLLGLSGGPSAQIPHEAAGSRGSGSALERSTELARWVDETSVLAQPSVEEVDRPEARIYDLSEADLAVVMIVDASLDV